MKAVLFTIPAANIYRKTISKTIYIFSVQNNHRLIKNRFWLFLKNYTVNT